MWRVDGLMIPLPLRELEAKFIRQEVREDGTYLVPVEQLTEAEGVMFVCPQCYRNLGGRAGAHSVICWFTGVDPERDPKPGRWNAHGTGLDDLSFVAPGAVSVRLLGGCNWHGFVLNGKAG